MASPTLTVRGSGSAPGADTREWPCVCQPSCQLWLPGSLSWLETVQCSALTVPFTLVCFFLPLSAQGPLPEKGWSRMDQACQDPGWYELGNPEPTELFIGLRVCPGCGSRLDPESCRARKCLYSRSDMGEPLISYLGN